jgi:WASH complex subunit 7
MKDLSGTIKFIPKEAAHAEFTEILKELGIDENNELYKTTKNFEDTMKLLMKKEVEVKDYLRNLVNVFYGVFKGEAHKHMRLFYILIPSLTINFVESIKTAKDKILKKRQTGQYFSDDGFALGLAFVLKVLGQTKRFASLNWFESIEEKLRKDETNIQGARERTDDEDVEVNKEISMRNVKTLSEEYSLVYYSFEASKIFFNDI